MKVFHKHLPLSLGISALVLTVSFFVMRIATVVHAANTSWTIYQNAPILTPSLPTEGNNMYAPDIHKEGNIWKVWYGGQGTDGHDRIHYATSNDGLSWTKQGVVLSNPQANHVNDPSVVAVDGQYFMYFTEATDTDRIKLAISTDGINWQDHGVVLDVTTGSWGTNWTSRPSVIYENKTFKLWYDSKNEQTGLRDVGYAFSTDGMNFTKSSANPVLQNAGAIDVKKLNGQYIMVYEGGNGTFWASSPDETHFTNQGLLFALTGGSQDQYGQVTPMIFLDELGQWTRTYFGGASHSCWCQNRIFVATTSLCLPADINRDGTIDLQDYSILAANFLRTSLSNPRADIDQNGIVDLRDYSILVANFFKQQVCQ